YEFWHLSLEDAIDTTGAAFLGMTLRCARCHDHKFDPVSREDYYGLYAIFASTVFPYGGSEEFASMNRPRGQFVPLASDAQDSLAAYRKRLADLTAQIKGADKEDPLARRIVALDSHSRDLENVRVLLHSLPVDAIVRAAKAGLKRERDQVARTLQARLND